ncbi:hypothetical protein M9Y10_011376 [Tritrichomonas musculus]|uniref:Serine/threonine-protein kinase PLK n=1 Tax=Tritrichomonas musculus TaxID=1915356 RepID=A0ABR2IJ74_9EUKA
MSRPKVILPPTITRTHPDGRIDKYNVHEVLGQGGFGTVYRISKFETKEEYALKVTPFEILKTPKLMRKHRMEIEIQRKLNHENILKSYDYFEDSSNTYIVLELCPHQSIKHLLRKKKTMTEVETASIIREIVNGLIYLHDNRIIHRDLKLENFLIGKDGHIKIADFGLSTRLEYDDQRRFTVCGTPNYLSPEILCSSSKGHSYEVDIWAIGVCAFALLTGKPPFETKKLKSTYEHIRSCSYSFPPELRLSFVAKDFVRSILQINPEVRPSAIELSLHPFLALADKKPTAHKSQKDQHKKFTTIFPENKPEEQKQEQKQEKKQEPKQEPKQDEKPKIEPKEQNTKPKNIINPQVFQQKQEIKPKIEPQEQNTKPKNIINPQIFQKKQELHKDENLENLENLIPLPLRKPLQPLDINVNENTPDDCKEEYQKAYETAPDYCVSRFCDHSDKYGLGYLLLNGTVGACFNDATRMVMDPHENFIQYWNSYQCTFPVILTKSDQGQRKKIMILMKFAESLKKTKTMYHIPEKEEFVPTVALKHVKYWMRSQDSLLFRMDNRIIQVNFSDKMKLIIFWNSKKMMLVPNIKESGKIIMIHDLPKLPGIDEEKRRFALAKAMLEEMNG